MRAIVVTPGRARFSSLGVFASARGGVALRGSRFAGAQEKKSPFQGSSKLRRALCLRLSARVVALFDSLDCIYRRDHLNFVKLGE